MNKLFGISILTLVVGGFSCRSGPEKTKNERGVAISEDALLTLAQYQTFQYFWEGAEPNSGLAPERIHLDGIYPDDDKNVVTSGGSGFGVMAILVGLERGFITREAAVQRFEKILRQWCIENLLGYARYGEDCWGLTASYSPRFYAAHRPQDEYFGVITPTAALSSFPYTPKESMQVLRFLYAPERDSLIGKYGPIDAFSFETNWYLPWYLAIDQGPIPVMIENHRSGLLWDLFMSAPEVQNGLNKLGFTYE